MSKERRRKREKDSLKEVKTKKEEKEEEESGIAVEEYCDVSSCNEQTVRAAGEPSVGQEALPPHLLPMTLCNQPLETLTAIQLNSAESSCLCKRASSRGHYKGRSVREGGRG